MSFRPTARGFSGMPLGSVDAVAFDTETTSLDVRKARIIEIAGVRIKSGRIELNSAHACLINPEGHIPESSTKVHGITDGMVSDSPPFRDAVVDFVDWCGSSLLLGYSVEYDLAVLEAEHGRCGVLWLSPEVLDVQELVQVLRPDIDNWTMESVAKWLSVNVEDRHRALADAKLTAEIYCRLLPLLQDAGITTVGEARRICQTKRQETFFSRRTTRKQIEPPNFHSFPYRCRVGDVMSRPAAIIDRGVSLRAAVGWMVDQGVTSLFVSGFEDSKHGILTESDVMRAISGKGDLAMSEPSGLHCSRPLRTVAEKEFVYRAIVSMTSFGIRHLGVVSGDGSLVGAVTAKDTFGSHGSDAISLGNEIEAASTPAELGRVWSDLGAVARSLLNSSVEPRKISAVISRELRAMTTKSCDLAQSEIVSKLGSPPVEFTVLVLGSGGRGESLLAMDQDNAIVFGGDVGTDAGWFIEFGKLMNSILHQSGVKSCPGGIMASNPEWCRHTGAWRSTISEWMTRTGPSDLMNVDIFFDAMPVYGHSGIASDLRQSTLAEAKVNRPFIARLAKRACEINQPFGMFGRWKLDGRRRVDLKMHGLMPLFSAARALALENGIQARSTAGRLAAAADAGACDRTLTQDLMTAHGIILGTVLRQQLRDSDNGVALSNSISPAELSNFEKQELRWAVLQVPRIADLLDVPAVI